jgi:hypothetical protein
VTAVGVFVRFRAAASSYGTQKGKRLFSLSKVVSNSAMENLTVLSPQQMLQGQAAGVQVVQSSGLLGGATVKIRGYFYYSWW